MFDPVNIPYGAKMLFNVVKLKAGVSFDDIELSIGELCNTVKNTYGNEQGGFIAGQVFKYSGFISEQGSISATNASGEQQQDHVAIVTYWNSFEQHETSHADETFNLKFKALADLCDDTYEIGYDMLWQGMAED
ncbi:MAG: hypothetical protein ACI845_000043 [Gammaproteobacteria bacterium]|jgi:hypothetical protein